MKKVTLGGDRLGSGNNQSIYMDGFHASNHDLSYVFRSTMDCGTLVPFMKIPMMIGDNFDIDLSALIKTLPTGGPLYGSFAWQAHLFFCPNRLYIGGLHNNATGIGRKMGDVLLPTITYPVPVKKFTEDMYDPNQEQIAPDSLTAYLGIRGLGENTTYQEQTRSFNGLPFLAVADIFKNFYSNKQEEYAYMISAIKEEATTAKFTSKQYIITSTSNNLVNQQTDVELNANITTRNFFIVPDGEYKFGAGATTIKMFWWYTNVNLQPYPITLPVGKYTALSSEANGREKWSVKPEAVTKNINGKPTNGYQITIEPIDPQDVPIGNKVFFNPSATDVWSISVEKKPINYGTNIKKFKLENIDEARDIILSKSKIGQKVDIARNGDINFSPYVDNVLIADKVNASKTPKNGLLLRTYLSDLYNNWLNTEWIDEINAATAIQVGASGSFTMDALIISKRTWEYQNRVGVSGGTYQDWEEAAYGREAQRFCESPIFVGGASGIIGFEEVVSTAASGTEALGSLAGQGGLHGFKGGKINVKAQEHGYLIGIVSIVPHIDYSQGNDWDMTELKSMESYHMPNFDGIGFQDLITERMAAWDTKIKNNGVIEQKSAGKQPAWSQYMSEVNKVYGDFCRAAGTNTEGSGADYMVINRQYQHVETDNGIQIGDLTTYVFPQHYNYLFATNSIEDNPFWVQIGCKIFARRIMSAAIMPTL